MPDHVRPYLLAILRRALTLGVEEVRFASGQLPVFKLATQLQLAEEAPVRGEVVRALHEECLRQAKRDDLSGQAVARYEFILPGLGAFGCEYQSAGDAPSLRITPLQAGEPAIASAPHGRPLGRMSGVEPCAPQEAGHIHPSQ
jgi:hypothetical protein